MNDDPHQHLDRDSDSSEGQHRQDAGPSTTHNFNGNGRASEKGKRKSEGFASRQAYGDVAESRDGSIMGGVGTGTGTGTDRESVDGQPKPTKRRNRKSKKRREDLKARAEKAKAVGGKEAEMDLDEDEESDDRGRKDRPIDVDGDDDGEDMDLDEESIGNGNAGLSSSVAPTTITYQDTLPRPGNNHHSSTPGRNSQVNNADRREYWANKGPRQQDTPERSERGGGGGRNARPTPRQPSPVVDFSNVQTKDQAAIDANDDYIPF